VKSAILVLAIVIWSGLILPLNAVAGLQEKKPSPSESAKTPALDVIAAWVPKRIVVNRNEVSPGDGHMFLAVQAMPKGVKNLRGLHQAYFDKDMKIIGIETRIEGWGSMYSGDVALTDSGGNRYNPIGCISSRFVFFQSKTMMTDIFQLTSPDGHSFVGEALVYLYEVPKGRGGFKLTVRDSQPIPVELKT
jgi:hypothetical protein